MNHANTLVCASLSLWLMGCKGNDNAIGRPCDLLVDAGMSQAVYNASAGECPSNTCLKPVVQQGATMPDPPTQAHCSATCSDDSECVGEARDPANPLDNRCMKGFTCGIPFVKGPLCCQKFCMCKDFVGTAGAPTPIACQGDGAGTCGGATSGTPMSSLSGVGQETDIYVSIAPNRLLDLVFMVDNSPSMAPKVTKMSQQFPRLIEALKDPNDGTLPDLRVAIIDSDLGTGGAYTSGPCGPKILPGGNTSLFGDMGRFQMINAASCGVTDPAASYLEYKAGRPLNYAGEINTVFACLAGNLGVQGCGEQHSLQAFEFALVAGGLGNEAQHTMLRPNAYLGLVFLTDEDDCSAAVNDGMFGDKPELRGESASLRCSTRSHQCSGINLTAAPPGYPTSSAFTVPLTTCAARTDACPNPTDGTGSTDTAYPTACSPLKDVRRLADEIKGLKDDPEQILVAGIFGWPLNGSDMATTQYKIDRIPNPNVADTVHPTIFDAWPVCYDPNHQPADPSTYDATAAGWGATAGLRNAAFIDEFGASGLTFSICAPDFSGSMKVIGETIAKKVHNLCVPYKLVDADPATPGLQPDCRVVYRTPQLDPLDASRVIYSESPTSLPVCQTGASADNLTEDCWQLANDLTKCPGNGQWIQILRPAQEILAGPLPAGTKIGMQCRTCPDSVTAADVAPGCE